MPIANFSSVRAFLFDLDGTLIDSKLDLVNSVNFMLLEMQREVLPLATVASYIGHGAPRLVADVLGPDAEEADRKRGLEIFLAYYSKHSLDATRVSRRR
jgi:phosphoglycolate phosphatase